MKAKILHILPTLGKGGAARVVIDLVNYGVSEGHEVELLVTQDTPIQNRGILETIDDRVKLKFALKINADIPHKSNLKGSISKIFTWVLFCKWVWDNRKFISQFQIVHVHMPIAIIGGNLIWLLKKKYKWKLKVFETVHSDSKSLKWTTSMLLKYSWRFRDGIIFEIRKEDLDIYYTIYPEGNATFIPLGVKPISNTQHDEFRKKIRDEIGITDSTVVVGQVGRLNVQDRRTDKYPILFKAIADRVGEEKKVCFILFGDGPDRLLIEKQISLLGLDKRIVIFGFVDCLEMAFSAIDIYVTLNIRRDCGIAGLQAISYNLPTFALQGDSTYLGGEADWIPSSQSIDILADMIVESIDNLELKNKLVLSQRKYFEQNVSYKLMGKNTLDFYSK